MNTIFSSFNIKNIKIKNRIVLPPLVRFSMLNTDGFVTDRLLKWYEKVSINGYGLIIAEATAVEESGKLRANQLGIWDDKFIEGLKKISAIAHKHEIPIIIQLHHAGFKEDISNEAKVTKERLDEITELFSRAIKRAKKANFDGIELHGAHTYLISQLNSKLWNKRKDIYGDGIYFSKKIIEENRHIFDDNFILSYRMGGNEPTLEDGIVLAKKLQELKVDILNVSTGVPDETFRQKCKIKDFPEDFPLSWVVYMGTEIKKQLSIPVIGVGGIKKEFEASWLIENDLLDFVAIGKASIYRPNWVGEAKQEFVKRNENKIY